MILIRMETLLVILAVQALNTLIYIRSHRALLFSNVALRQQLGIYKRKRRRPGLKNRDRLGSSERASDALDSAQKSSTTLHELGVGPPDGGLFRQIHKLDVQEALVGDA